MAFQEYLPSKAFQKRVFSILLIIASILTIGLLIKLIGRGIDSFKIRKQIKLLPVELRSQVDSLTVGDLQRKDSNNNGVLDWEERLYGLDPLTDGETNKKLVEQKREILKLSAVDNEANASIGETNDFTREFLSIITSLGTSGAINEDSLQNIANSVGSKLISPEQKEIYTTNDLIVVRDSAIAMDDYKRLSALALEKTGAVNLLGHETEFLSESLIENDPILLAPLDNISEAYISFAKSLSKIPVPESLVSYHKAIINSSTYIGDSLIMVQKIYNDPMSAVQGIAMYNTHFIIMNSALDELAAKLNL